MRITAFCNVKTYVNGCCTLFYPEKFSDRDERPHFSRVNATFIMNPFVFIDPVCKLFFGFLSERHYVDPFVGYMNICGRLHEFYFVDDMGGCHYVFYFVNGKGGCFYEFDFKECDFLVKDIGIGRFYEFYLEECDLLVKNLLPRKMHHSHQGHWHQCGLVIDCI